MPIAPGAQANAEARGLLQHLGLGLVSIGEAVPCADRTVAAAAVAAKVDDAELMATVHDVGGLRPGAAAGC
eukprot:1591024-Alexandrium_andersonii.AAC.1